MKLHVSLHNRFFYAVVATSMLVALTTTVFLLNSSKSSKFINTFVYSTLPISVEMLKIKHEFDQQMTSLVKALGEEDLTALDDGMYSSRAISKRFDRLLNSLKLSDSNREKLKLLSQKHQKVTEIALTLVKKGIRLQGYEAPAADDSKMDMVISTLTEDLTRVGSESLELKEMINDLSSQVEKSLLRDSQELDHKITKTNRVQIVVVAIFIILLLALGHRFAFSIIKPTKSILHFLENLAHDNVQTSIDLKNSANSVSNTSLKQIASIQETVSSLEQLFAMVSHTTERNEYSVNIAQRVADQIDESRETLDQMLAFVSNMHDSMQLIKSESQKVNVSTDSHLTQILDVIREISEKTRILNNIVSKTQLLSFNASIEAAKAGQHGRGFAVVAEEIGNLASLSGNASKAIGSLITDSKLRIEKIIIETQESAANAQTSVKDGIRVSHEATLNTKKAYSSLGEIISQVKEITDHIKELNVAALEQKSALKRISDSINDIEDMTISLQNNSLQNKKVAQTVERQSIDLNKIRATMAALVHGDTQT